MGPNLFPINCYQAVCELLLSEQTAEDADHVVLVIVPSETVLRMSRLFHVVVVVVIVDLGQQTFQFRLLSLCVHLGAQMLDDSGLLSPLDDAVAKFAQKQVAVDNSEVFSELLLDVIYGSNHSWHPSNRRLPLEKEGEQERVVVIRFFWDIFCRKYREKFFITVFPKP